MHSIISFDKYLFRTYYISGPLEKEMATYSRFLPGKSHGQRSLAGYSSWGHKESDMTEQLSLTHNKKWKFLSVAGHLQKGELSEIVDWISIGIHRLRVIFWTFLFLFPWGM